MRISSRLPRLSIAAAITVVILVAIASWPIGLPGTSAQASVPNQPDNLAAEAGDTQVRLSWADPEDSTIDKYQLWQITQSATLTGANTEFGYSVAVVGDIAVVGMPDDDESGPDSGAALVFSRVEGVWTQKYWLRTGDDAGVVKDDGFGSSIVFDGNTIVVGAPFDDSKKGAAYLFVEPGDGWDNQSGTGTVDLTDPAKLTAPNASVEDEFGNSVAVDGNTVVVGAYSDDSTDTDGSTVANSGSAYVFTKPGNAWVSTSTAATLTASDAAAGDEFGSSVAVDGNTVVVGASGDDGDALFTGSAFVFVKPSSGGWVSTSTAAKLTAETRGDDDYFGRSVAIDGDTIVVGADGQDTNTGSAFVFAEPSGGWVNNTETAKLTASVRSSGHRFGFSVALDGETVVVGAYGEAGSRGSAYAFTKPGTGWDDGTEAAQLTASDRATNDSFGFSVAVDGGTVVVGAENNETAYVFDIDDWADIADSNAATTSHIVTGLTNGTEHTFRVRAVDGGEASDPSDSVVGTPKAATYAPVKLLNFSAAQTGDGEVELTWDAHRYPLTVTGYEYKQDSGDWTAITGSDFGTHSYTVTGLTQGVTYGFRVRAVNGAGSTESDSRSVTIIGQSAAPDSFTAVAGDEQVWLGWRNPADFTISGYEYQQKTGVDFGDDWTSIPGSRSGTTFHIVTGLTNDTSYTFRVRAVNAAGGSDASVEQSATPAQASSAPVKPEGFAARQTGVGQVELTWEASSNPLNVTGYQFKQNSGSWTAISESDHSTVSHIITGLTQGAAYIFRVRAVNSAGSTESDSPPVTIVDKPAAPDPFATEAGDTQVGLTWKDPGNASIAKYQIFQFPESIIKLISSDHDGGDELGFSVAVDDDTLVIGALGDDDGDSLNVGAAYVFTRVAGGWTQAGKLTAGDRKYDAGFGHAVAVHGETIVVGAYEEDHPDNINPLVDIADVGAAYVFTKPANGWADMTQTARLTASDAAAGDEFGTSVAVHEDTIVVGAHEEHIGARGSAYIFTRPANDWADMTETAALRGESGGDRFGRSVAVHGDTVVVGAFEVNGTRGAAYLFTEPGGGWTSTSTAAKLTASDRASGDRFGRAVAMDGDTIVIGAPYHDYDDPDNNTNDVSNSGAAYVFIKTATGGWATDTETAKLTASERAENDQFGFSVAVDGNTVVVGADQDDNNRGSAYVFTEPQGGWTDTEGTDPLTAYGRSQNDRFGNFVAVDGDTVLVGAVGEDSAKGSAYVFGTGEWADIPGSGAETISHIARGLLNNVKHTFRVRAVNAAGAGDASEADAKAVAANSLPSRPADLTATQTGVGQVRLAWPASTEPLTVRRYQYKQNDGSGFGNWIGIEGSDSSTASHTITGLIAGIEYSFTVGAVNGGGQKASDVGSVTLEAQAGAPSNLDADAGDEQVKLSWDDPGDSTIDEYQHFQIDPSKLTAADGLRGDEFGYSVAVDGNTAVVGAYQDDDATNGDDSGSAYVFTRDPDSGMWGQVAKLTASDGAENDEFGYSVAVDGVTIVVGARGDGGNTGAVYVFTKPGTDDGWKDWDDPNKVNKASLTSKLIAYQGAADDEFGISVAVDGNTILVGAPGNQNTVGGTDVSTGAAYIFTKFSGVWGNAPVSGNHRVETAKLIAYQGAADDEFGISVAVDGHTAVIGARQDDDSGDQSGSAYLFTKVSGVWSQKVKLIASDGAANDEFGISVAVDGDTVVIGAPQDDTRSGSAYVFTKVFGAWSQKAKLIASDGAADDEFGYSVALDGDTVVVGAYRDDDNGDLSGSAYVFIRNSNVWSQKAKLTGPSRGKGDWLGHSVAVVGNIVIAGADKSNIRGPDSGAVYLWTVPDWTIIDGSGATTTSDTITGLTNGQEYLFQVRGVNAAGEGLASNSGGATPQLPRPAQPIGFSAAPGDTQVKLSWNDPAGGSPPIANYQLWQHVENAILTADTREDNDEFGYAVAIDGDTAVVGMPGEDNPDNSGAAFVYTKDSFGTWSQVARLRPSIPEIDALFGNSVALQGSIIVVGAPREGTGSSGHGAVYVFTKDADSDWGNDANQDHRIETAKLLADGGGASDEFGWEAVAVNDDENTIVVGARNKNAAYIFTRPATGWANDTETLKLSRSGSSDDFGRSVAIDGDTIVVGASGYDSTKGSAFVFIEPDTGWANSPDTEVAELTAYSRNDNDRFGRSVAIDGGTIVVGAHQPTYQDGGETIKQPGAAYVFTKPDTGWANSPGSETAKLTASDRTDGDQFGVSVAMDGGTVVIGADALNEPNRSGSAYVFTKPAAGWVDSTEAAKLTGSDTANRDRFGLSVSVDGLTVMVGANGQGANSEGAAYVYGIQEWAPITGSTGETRSHFATGLTNGLEHTFAVRAVNGGGAGLPAQASADTATPGSPPLKPRNFSAVQTGAGEVRLEWGQVADPLNVTGYEYKQDTKNSDGTWTLGTWALIDPSDSATVSYTVSSLASDTTYTFTIRAVNSFGEGASSFPRDVTIVAAPDAPTDLEAEPGDEQVELSWRYSVGQTSITGFQYQQEAGEDDFGDDWTDIPGSDPDTTSHIVTGLTNNIEHAFRVRAVNVTIASAPSNTVTSIIPEAARSIPAGPTNFNAEQTGVGQVELTWDTAPARLSVTGYQYTADGGSDWNNITGSDSGMASHTVSQLDLGATYRFAVRAVNSGTLPGHSSRFRDVTIARDPGAPTGVSATGGDTQATVQWSVPSVITDRPIEHQLLQIPLSTLTAADGAANDEFGYSVAIDGSTAVVGAHMQGDNNAGAVYVFTEVDDVWSHAATLTASDGAANYEFGISVAIAGNTIVVGARQDDTRNGAAYVFTEAAGMWSQAKLIASDGAAKDELGISVAIDGNTIVVGARQDDTRNGAVYVFTKADDVAWANDSGENHKEEAAKLIASDGAANDELGISVAIDGDTVVAGAHLHDINDNGTDIPNAGAAYVFTKPAGGWIDNTEGAKFTAPDGAAKDEFGISVAIDVDTVAVGAHQPTYQENNMNVDVGPGAAYVFTRDSNSGKWGQPVKLTASNGVLGDGFGISVAVDGNTAVVGASLDDRDAAVTNSGSAYVFARDPNSGKWGETHNLAAPGLPQDYRFGRSVAADDGTLLAGAPQKPDASGSESAYVMNILDAEWEDLVSTELTDDDMHYLYRVLNLTNDQQYAFRVRAVNDAAKRPSAETVAATPMHMKPGRTEGLSPQPGDSQVTLSWDDPRDSSIDGYQVLQAFEPVMLTAGSDREDDGRFGGSVAVDAGAAVVGAPKHDINGNTDAGAAYVFTRDSSTGKWSDPIELTAGSEGEDNGRFGGSVAVDAGAAVVGAPWHDISGNTDAGAAYVFTRDSSTGKWSDPIELTAGSDGAENDEFGYSVAVDGETIVVGARQHDINGNSGAGAAYVFTKADGAWSETPVKLIASDGGEADYFGYSVAVDGKTIVIGARGDATTPGAAYVFTKVDGVWGNAPDLEETHREETAKLAASNAKDNDQFGQSVAVDGTTVVVGAPREDGSKGSAYVFTKPTDNDWADNIETARLAASDRGGNDSFGSSVAVRGSTIVVGADNADIDPDDDDGARSGATYVFSKPDGAVWTNNPNEDYRTESDKLILPTDEEAVEKSDEFGNSVALDAQSIVVGAPQDNLETDDDNSGSVYVSDIPKWDGIADSTDETTFYTVTDLENGMGYIFQVRAVDEAGEGPPSDIVRAMPMPAPDAPTNFTATGRNARVRLAWDDPNDLSITRYEYRRARGGGGFGSAIGISGSNATTTSYMVSGLANGVRYRFQIRAVNYYGAGDWSAPSNATPRAPNRAPNFIIGSDTVTFSVDENTPPGTPVGSALTARDRDGDRLSYSLSGTDASSFDIDSSTGQLIVKAPLDYETQSVYEVTVRVSDNNNASDGVDVTITISDVDEAGTVSVSLERPEVGTALVVSLSDPDGLVSNISWHWATSLDGFDWIDISGANSDSYTPVADDVGFYLRATVSYTDRYGPGKSAHAVMERQTAQRGPSFEGDVTLTVAENTPPGALVGEALTATNPDGDILTYALSGPDASLFVLDGSTGQIVVGSGTLVDYESGPARYTVIVTVHDGRDAYGNADATIDDSIEVEIEVANVDESGTVSVSPREPEVGTALTASLSDPDGSLSDISWHWARSSDGANWQDIAGAASDVYTPVADEVGVYLRATASYTDGQGSGKSAHAVSGGQTAQRDPSFEGDVTLLTVAENTPPGALVGEALAATDVDGDILTYALSGPDASFFVLDGATGQIVVGSGTLVDYESGPARYTVIVTVHDGRDAYGNADATIDDSIEVEIEVANVDEAGTVTVFPEQPEVGTVMAASLSDPDGSLSDISWQWARSSDSSDWSNITGAASDVYTPVADEVGVYLRATASYTDGQGSGKSAHAVSGGQTAQRAPSFEGDVTLLTVAEDAPPGALVGEALAATDVDGDILTYTLSGPDASFFVLDGATGQIVVGSGTLVDYESGPARYTVIVSVHDGRDAYGNADAMIDDSIEVEIEVANVDEAGEVTVSPEQPEVGTALTTSLSDPDGSVSDISWQWARSSDGANWQDIAGADSDVYTPVADEVGVYLRATASYTDGQGSGKSAHAVSGGQTAQRDPSFEGDVTLTVDENTSPGALVGEALAATDVDGDILTYTLSGPDASFFVLDGATGQIVVGSGTLVDYESGPARYTVIVSVHDGRDAYGNDDATTDDSIEVEIEVANVDESGTVSVSPGEPEVGTVMAASLSDPDGSVSDISWQWARSSDGANWQDIAGAASSAYIPVELDANKYLRVAASYVDGEGFGKQAVLSNLVQGLPDPFATPTPEPTDMAVPSPTPAALPIAPVDDGGISLWWIILLAAGAVAGAAGIYIIVRNRGLR